MCTESTWSSFLLHQHRMQNIFIDISMWTPSFLFNLQNEMSRDEKTLQTFPIIMISFILRNISVLITEVFTVHGTQWSYWYCVSKLTLNPFSNKVTRGEVQLLTSLIQLSLYCLLHFTTRLNMNVLVTNCGCQRRLS